MNTGLDVRDTVRTGPWPTREAWTCAICDEVHEVFMHREHGPNGLLFAASVRNAMSLRAVSREGWLLMKSHGNPTWLCGPCANAACDVTDDAYTAAVGRWVQWTDVEIVEGRAL